MLDNNAKHTFLPLVSFLIFIPFEVFKYLLFFNLSSIFIFISSYFYIYF